MNTDHRDPAHHDAHLRQAHGFKDHDHFHGTIDPALLTTEKGIQAIKWSMAVLLLTALLQVAAVTLSSSVALLADTIHNFGDAATGILLWIAFVMARKRPTKRFNYGLGRVEDVAGIVIVFVMLLSGIAVAYMSFTRLFEPHQIQYLAAVGVASILGFVGNEAAAVIRIRTGRDIGSVALIADGHHVSATLMKMLYRAKGARGICLVTDATAGAGLKNGSHFSLGDLDCLVDDGVCWLADHSALAGSSSRMIDLVRTLVQTVDVPLHEAIMMATENPARVLHVEKTKGRLVRGADADLVVLSPELEVLRTFSAGEEIFAAADS